jgi:hypothetical protein
MVRNLLPARFGTVVCVLGMVSVVNYAVYAQDHTREQVKDTNEHLIRLIDPGISLGKPAFLLPPTLDIIPDDLLGMSDNTLIGSTPFFPLVTTQKIDLISPFKLQRAKEEEFRTWRAILGSVQLGGVAYLAYRHIKKYGLR